MTERIIVDANGRKHITHEPAPTSREYERGFVDGMQEQMRRSVDKAVNSMTRKKWVDLTDEEVLLMSRYDLKYAALIGEVQRALKEKNT